MWSKTRHTAVCPLLPSCLGIVNTYQKKSHFYVCASYYPFHVQGYNWLWFCIRHFLNSHRACWGLISSWHINSPPPRPHEHIQSRKPEHMMSRFGSQIFGAFLSNPFSAFSLSKLCSSVATNMPVLSESHALFMWSFLTGFSPLAAFFTATHGADSLP